MEKIKPALTTPLVYFVTQIRAWIRTCSVSYEVLYKYIYLVIIVIIQGHLATYENDFIQLDLANLCITHVRGANLIYQESTKTHGFVFTKWTQCVEWLSLNSPKDKFSKRRVNRKNIFRGPSI